MARTGSSLDNMSYAELTQMEARIARMKVEKQNAERAELRERILTMVKEHGFEISDLFGKGRKGKGVAVKYRDPQNPETPGPVAVGCRGGSLRQPKAAKRRRKISSHRERIEE